MLSVQDCEHLSLISKSRVNRVTDDETGRLVCYNMDVTVKCLQCGVPFLFLGLPRGIDLVMPKVSGDLQEARLPITPITGDTPTQKVQQHPLLRRRTDG